MTHTDLIARLRLKGPQAHEQPNHHMRRMEIERIEAADALTAAQEREKVLEAALTRIENLAGLVAHDLTGRVEGGKVAAVYQCAEVARAALDATEKGGDPDASQNTAKEYDND